MLEQTSQSSVVHIHAVSEFRYKRKAMTIAAMLNDKPFTARETFVRNMEFLAKHGPLRQLDHYGRHLNFFQYYLLDVVGAVILSLLVIISVALLLTVKVLSCFARTVGAKTKKE